VGEICLISRRSPLPFGGDFPQTLERFLHAGNLFISLIYRADPCQNPIQCFFTISGLLRGRALPSVDASDPVPTALSSFFEDNSFFHLRPFPLPSLVPNSLFSFFLPIMSICEKNAALAVLFLRRDEILLLFPPPPFRRSPVPNSKFLPLSHVQGMEILHKAFFFFDLFLNPLGTLPPLLFLVPKAVFDLSRSATFPHPLTRTRGFFSIGNGSRALFFVPVVTPFVSR